MLSIIQTWAVVLTVLIVVGMYFVTIKVLVQFCDLTHITVTLTVMMERLCLVSATLFNLKGLLSSLTRIYLFKIK